MKFNLILTKLCKFVIFVLFTFMTLVYAGVLLVLPLGLAFDIFRLFHGLGLPTALAAGVGVAALAYLGYAIWKMPALYGLLLDIGKQLVSFGHGQIQRFDALSQPATSGKA